MEASGFSHGDWREWRRFQALRLKEQGWYQRDIAEALGASEDAVSRWLARARDDGPEALLARPSPGRPPKLSPAQKRLIPEFLWHGAEAYGFRGDVWTCARVARVIEEEFGVSYHKDHVGRLLLELRWTPQTPIRRATQRDEEAIRRWRADVWPELLRRARRERRVLVFEDEAGFYLLPGLVRTYAPGNRHRDGKHDRHQKGKHRRDGFRPVSPSWGLCLSSSSSTPGSDNFRRSSRRCGTCG